MSTVEKNDVDIKPLFRWNRTFEITNSNGEVEDVVFMKLLGDADLNIARIFALRKSAELRRKLRDVDSDERLAYIREIEDVDSEQLIKMNELFNLREISRKARENTKLKRPTPPRSDAPLEETEKFQKEVDEYPAKLSELIKKDLDKRLKEFEKDLEKKSKEELYDLYVKAITDELCEQEVLNRFKEMSVYFGTYKDETCKERYFESFESFENLGTNLKSEFISAFQSLEIGMEELKKLRQVTQ